MHLHAQLLHALHDLTVRVLHPRHQHRPALHQDDAFFGMRLAHVRRHLHAHQPASDDQHRVAVPNHRGFRSELTQTILARGVPDLDVGRVPRPDADHQRVVRHHGAFRPDLHVRLGDGHRERRDVLVPLAAGEHVFVRHHRVLPPPVLGGAGVAQQHGLRGDILEVVLGVHQRDVEPVRGVFDQVYHRGDSGVAAAENHHPVLFPGVARDRAGYAPRRGGVRGRRLRRHHLPLLRVFLLQESERGRERGLRRAERRLQRLEHALIQPGRGVVRRRRRRARLNLRRRGGAHRRRHRQPVARALRQEALGDVRRAGLDQPQARDGERARAGGRDGLGGATELVHLDHERHRLLGELRARDGEPQPLEHAGRAQRADYIATLRHRQLLRGSAHDGLGDVLGVRLVILALADARSRRGGFPGGVVVGRRRAGRAVALPEHQPQLLCALLGLQRVRQVVVAHEHDPVQVLGALQRLLLLARHPHSARVQEKREPAVRHEPKLRRHVVWRPRGVFFRRPSIQIVFLHRSLELELVVALVVALRERERVLLHEAPHHLQVVGGAAHEESSIRRQIRLLRLVVEDAHGEHVRLRLDALGERHHGVLHGRGAEHLAEAQHGDLLRARETLLADGQNGVGVHLDARLLHFKP
mmetsp:Transcript_10577/g.45015  ORF Transcript_10577/g.45015 Transcript_10577/m.45015 type:complete len:642 (+) Transcript_10577:847-2772(+)